MAFLNGINNLLKKTEAAVIVQNTLEDMVVSVGYQGDPAKVANLLVSNVWNNRPDIYSGKLGRRPHKVSIAIAAFAGGLTGWRDQLHHGHPALALGLAKLLKDANEYADLYDLGMVDEVIIGQSADVLADFAQNMPGGDLPERLGL